MARDPLHDTVEHNERRIGERHPISVPIEWYPTLKPPKRRHGPRSSRTENLSFSGAGFIDDAHPDVFESTLLTVTMKGVTGQARVRVVRDTATKGRSYFGVEFTDRQLLDTARALIADHAPVASKRFAPMPPTERTSGYRDWPG